MLSTILQAIDRADTRIDQWFTGSAPVEQRGQATTWGEWPGETSTMTVNQTSALKLLAVTGSVQLLTESIATLPIDVFATTSTGRAERAKPMWLREPIVGLTFTDWCTQVLTSLLLHGNAFIVVTRNQSGQIVELTPVVPSQVTVDRSGTLGGRKRYLVKGTPFTGEMVHVKGMMLPGADVGLSPLEFAYQSIQLGLSAQQYGIDNFDSGLKMPGVIEYPGAVDPAKMGETARLWQRMRRKGGHGLPGVLEGGGTFKAMGITNEAAQFLETRQWTAAEICAQVYLIDPRELGIPLTGSTLEYVNSESRMANLVRKGMLRWITRIEAAITALLPNPQYMKFNVNGFMRGDSTERWDTYLKAAQINEVAAATGQKPVLLTDEMRDWEDLDPLPASEISDPPDASEPADPADDPAEDMADRTQPVVVNIDNRQEHHIHNEQEPPVFNVPTPAVNIDNRSEPAVVNVTTPEVVVNVPEARQVEPSQTVRRVERDDDGRIVRVIDEEQ
jgi:HK97 family phage portal protein